MRLIWPLLLTLILLGCTGRSPDSDLILKSAEDGDHEAQLKLAFAHMANPGDRDPLSGTPLQIPGIEFDERKAVYWLQKAATNGIGRAQLVLGHRYLFGAGVPLDFKAALGWYRQAAAKDTPHAENGINTLLAILDSPYRSEVDKRAIRDAFADEIKTTEELMRTALTGDVVSARRYGERLCDGVGVSRNYAEGLKFLRDAAERGDMKAQCRMGFIFKTGRGVTADFREAAKWLEKAAGQGDAWAQFNLSLAFFTGKGVKANEVEALRLLRASAASKYTPARSLLAKIETNPLVAKKLELEIPIH